MNLAGGAVALALVAFFSLISLWDNGDRDKLLRAVLFILTAGIAFPVAFYVPDIVSGGVTNTLSIGIALSLIGYSFLCAGVALRLMFWRAE